MRLRLTASTFAPLTKVVTTFSAKLLRRRGFFWRESRLVNENHARRRASMPKVAIARSSLAPLPLKEEAAPKRMPSMWTNRWFLASDHSCGSSCSSD